MSYHEALRDGIPTGRDKRGNSAYYPPCGICGIPTYSPKYNPKFNYTCKTCKEKATIDAFEFSTESRMEVKERKLEKAIERISRVVTIEDYQRAIEWVRKNISRPQWFESTEEIMVALELIKLGVKSHHQVKILNFRADFVLTEEKIVLEIDGTPFHGKDRRAYEQERDNAIITVLGDDWDVVRISTNHINKNITKLMPAVIAVKSNRQRYRKSFNGTLPKWYSDTAVRKKGL